MLRIKICIYQSYSCNCTMYYTSMISPNQVIYGVPIMHTHIIFNFHNSAYDSLSQMRKTISVSMIAQEPPGRRGVGQDPFSLLLSSKTLTFSYHCVTQIRLPSRESSFEKSHWERCMNHTLVPSSVLAWELARVLYCRKQKGKNMKNQQSVFREQDRPLALRYLSSLSL